MSSWAEWTFSMLAAPFWATRAKAVVVEKSEGIWHKRQRKGNGNQSHKEKNWNQSSCYLRQIHRRLNGSWALRHIQAEMGHVEKPPLILVACNYHHLNKLARNQGIVAHGHFFSTHKQDVNLHLVRQFFQTSDCHHTRKQVSGSYSQSTHFDLMQLSQ